MLKPRNERIAALELLPVVHGDSGKFVIQKDATTRVVLNKEVSLAGVEGVAITTDGLLLAGIPLSTDADDHSSQVNIQWLSLDADELAATAGKTIELDVTQTLNVGLGDGIGSSDITVEGLLPFQAPLPDQASSFLAVKPPTTTSVLQRVANNSGHLNSLE